MNAHAANSELKDHLVEEAHTSSGCSVWNRTSKLILRRLLWHHRALICCQCDEDPGLVPLFQHRVTNPQDLSRFSPSISPACVAKVKEVMAAYVHCANYSQVWVAVSLRAASYVGWGFFWSEIGVLNCSIQ